MSIYKFLDDVGLTKVFTNLKAKLDAKQDTLVSGTNIKSINNQSLVGSGNLDISVDVFRFKSSDAGNDGFFDDLLNAVNDRKRIILDEAGGSVIFAECISATVSYAPSLQKRRIELFFSTDYWKNSTITQGNLRNNILSLMLWENDTTFLTYYERNQEQLVSGTNIKTINNQSLLGSGNIDIPSGGTVDTAMSDTSGNAVQNKVIKSYVDGATGDLSTLTTDDKTSIVSAINEVYEKSGEPFRVKNWANSDLNVSIPYCTEEVANTSIAKMTYSIDAEEGASYQIVGMIAYEVFDSSNQRINCWPVCQFTGNGQKELSVRWACMGSSRKTATKINAWVLLKHR